MRLNAFFWGCLMTPKTNEEAQRDTNPQRPLSAVEAEASGVVKHMDADNAEIDTVSSDLKTSSSSLTGLANDLKEGRTSGVPCYLYVVPNPKPRTSSSRALVGGVEYSSFFVNPLAEGCHEEGAPIAYAGATITALDKPLHNPLAEEFSSAYATPPESPLHKRRSRDLSLGGDPAAPGTPTLASTAFNDSQDLPLLICHQPWKAMSQQSPPCSMPDPGDQEVLVQLPQPGSDSDELLAEPSAQQPADLHSTGHPAAGFWGCQPVEPQQSAEEFLSTLSRSLHVQTQAESAGSVAAHGSGCCLDSPASTASKAVSVVGQSLEEHASPATPSLPAEPQRSTGSENTIQGAPSLQGRGRRGRVENLPKLPTMASAQQPSGDESPPLLQAHLSEPFRATAPIKGALPPPALAAPVEASLQPSAAEAFAPCTPPLAARMPDAAESSPAEVETPATQIGDGVSSEELTPREQVRADRLEEEVQSASHGLVVGLPVASVDGADGPGEGMEVADLPALQPEKENSIRRRLDGAMEESFGSPHLLSEERSGLVAVVPLPDVSQRAREEEQQQHQQRYNLPPLPSALPTADVRDPVLRSVPVGNRVPEWGPHETAKRDMGTDSQNPDVAEVAKAICATSIGGAAMREADESFAGAVARVRAPLSTPGAPVADPGCSISGLAMTRLLIRQLGLLPGPRDGADLPTSLAGSMWPRIDTNVLSRISSRGGCITAAVTADAASSPRLVSTRGGAVAALRQRPAAMACGAVSPPVAAGQGLGQGSAATAATGAGSQDTSGAANWCGTGEGCEALAGGQSGVKVRGDDLNLDEYPRSRSSSSSSGSCVSEEDVGVGPAAAFVRQPQAWMPLRERYARGQPVA